MKCPLPPPSEPQAEPQATPPEPQAEEQAAGLDDTDSATRDAIAAEGAAPLLSTSPPDVHAAPDLASEDTQPAAELMCEPPQTMNGCLFAAV